MARVLDCMPSSANVPLARFTCNDVSTLFGAIVQLLDANVVQNHLADVTGTSASLSDRVFREILPTCA